MHVIEAVSEAQGLECGLHGPVLCTQMHRSQAQKKRLLKLPEEEVSNNHPAPQDSALRNETQHSGTVGSWLHP